MADDITTPAEFDPDELLQAKEAFSAPGPTNVAAGDLFRAGDPIVDGRRHLFEPVAARVRASVPGVPVSPAPFLDPADSGDDGQGGGGGGDGDTGATGAGKRTRKASGAA